MKLSLITVAFSVMAATAAQAQSFQLQTDADYSHLSVGGDNVDGLTVKQRYYLQPVQSNDNQPWKEAAFLSRSSSVNVDYSRLSNKLPGANDSWSLSGWGFGGEYMSDNHNFYGALQTRFLNGDDSFLAVGKAGFFLQPNWLVSLDLYHSNPQGQGSSTDYGISTKAIVPVMMGDHLVFTASWADFTDGNGYAVAADYYIRPYWSVGLGYRDDMPNADLTLDAANLYGKGTELRTEYFVTPQLALRANYQRLDLPVGHENQLGAGVSYRF